MHLVTDFFRYSDVCKSGEPLTINSAKRRALEPWIRVVKYSAIGERSILFPRRESALLSSSSRAGSVPFASTSGPARSDCELGRICDVSHRSRAIWFANDSLLNYGADSYQCKCFSCFS